MVATVATGSSEGRERQRKKEREKEIEAEDGCLDGVGRHSLTDVEVRRDYTREHGRSVNVADVLENYLRCTAKRWSHRREMTSTSDNQNVNPIPCQRNSPQYLKRRWSWLSQLLTSSSS